MASKPSVLIITGYGISGEAETRQAWELAGAAASLIHLQDLMENPQQLQAHQILTFTAGAVFGGYLGAGRVLAEHWKQHLGEELTAWLAADKLILGMGDGCLAMAKLGLLPGFDKDFQQTVTFINNDCGSFQNVWVTLGFDPQSPCIFTRNLTRMDLPYRHAEGRLLARDKQILQRLEAEHCAPCRYLDPVSGQPTQIFPHNPAGSPGAIAGLCDPSGRVFGLLPHPEGYLTPHNHPHWQQQRVDGVLPTEGAGLQIFRNAVAYLT